MKLNLPEEVQLTLMLRRMERYTQTNKYPPEVELKVRARIAEILGISLVTAEELDDAEEGFWTDCVACKRMTYLHGVGEFDICRVCHYEGNCLVPGACEDGECEVYP